MFPASDWYHENFRENITSNILLDLTIFHLTSILYKPKWLSCKRLINLKESRVKQIATTLSNPNIALIKYWGNRDERLRIPSNGSISINLAGLETRTSVCFDPTLQQDTLTLNGASAGKTARERVSAFLNQVRIMSEVRSFAAVVSENNFPTGAGIASSASAFAALALAAAHAAGLQLSEQELSRLARRGSGSACRSIPGGFVEWFAGDNDETSFAESFAPAGHWALGDCIAIISHAHKSTGSTEGHATASTSLLQDTRIATTPTRLETCRRAILNRDFNSLAEVAELDSNLMHAVMITSQPPLLYWQPATLGIMQAVQKWRSGGLPCFYTIDAGPNVHVICLEDEIEQVTARLQRLPGVLQVRTATVGGPARLIM